MQRVGFVVYPGFQTMSLAAASAFEFANLTLKRANYEVHCISEHGGPVSSSFGMTVQTEPFDRQPFDTLLMGGGVGVPPSTPALLDFMREAPQSSRRVAAICTGAFML